MDAPGDRPRRRVHGPLSPLPATTCRQRTTRLNGPVTASASLYRRHRPRTFADVVGQDHVVRTLRNAIEQDKVHHAYLFVGSRGHRQDLDGEDPRRVAELRERPDGDPVRRVRLVPRDRERRLARRDRDGRGVQQLGRRHPRPAREGRLRARLRPPQGLHPRRGAHADHGGVERVPQDARGAAAEHDLRARHDRGQQGAADGRGPLPPLRLLAAERARRSRRCSSASPSASRSRSPTRRPR